jgi:hypothetical protein
MAHRLKIVLFWATFVLAGPLSPAIGGERPTSQQWDKLSVLTASAAFASALALSCQLDPLPAVAEIEARRLSFDLSVAQQDELAAIYATGVRAALALIGHLQRNPPEQVCQMARKSLDDIAGLGNRLP